jgi:uncharacterized protein YodC (DUF2158 family)
MTVQVAPVDPSTSNYTCQWFAGKKLESGRFPESSLKPVEDDE